LRNYAVALMLMLPCMFYVGTEIAPEVSEGVTYVELKQYLNETCFECTGRNESYVCADYTSEFTRGLHEKGHFACATYIYLRPYGAHTVAAVNTTDRGVVYVDAEHDAILDEHELLAHFNVERIVSCYGRFTPKEHTCYFYMNDKQCY